MNLFQICLMLNSLENYVWRYNSAVELVNLIFTYIEQNALRVFSFYTLVLLLIICLLWFYIYLYGYV